MSQAKVDQYKKEKANRKKILARQKAQRIALTICGWVILLVIVGWAGKSGYDYYDEHRPAKTIVCDTSDLSEYIDGLSAEEE